MNPKPESATAVRRRSTRAPPEAELTGPDWVTFERGLAASLARMAEETYLIIETGDSTERPNYYVQLAKSRDAFRAEAVSSAYLPYRWKLSRRQVARLLDLGWQRPVKVEKGRNYYRNFELPPPASEIASMAIRSLRDVFGIPMPAELGYEYRSFEGASVEDLELPIERRVKTVPSTASRRPERPRAELTTVIEEGLRLLAIDQPVTDRDGDYPVRIGSALIYLRVHREPPQAVLLFSPILRDVFASPALLAVINDLNAGLRGGGRVFVHGARVIVVNELSALDLTADQVALACLDLGALADHLDDALHGRFGGKLMFSNEGGLLN